MKSNNTEHTVAPLPALIPASHNAQSAHVLERGNAETSPFHIKHILVPIDFSDCSRKAIKYALPLATQFNATLTLLHVADFEKEPPASQNPDSHVPEAQLLHNYQNHLHQWAKDEIRDTVACETLVWKGNAVSDIIAAAKSRHADLIIISTKGESGHKESVLGTTTERVVRHAPCPVLVVREKEHDFV